MFNTKIKQLFESDGVISGFLTLKKTEIDDATFIKHLSIKPSEINIILARTVSFIKGDPQKTKKELINDILEVLERSTVAREFVGIGVQQEYRLYKGFPVRKGDPYDMMPEPNSEMQLKPSELFIGWMTDASKARDDSIKYDAAKGDPIGGLLVDVHVDVSKILFDINAVIKTVKAKKALIDKYNLQAAPGKSLSKSNTDFLANEAPYYHGQWEIITTNKVVNVKVYDKWNWNTVEGKKTVKWVSSDKKEQQPTPAPNPNQKLQEQILNLFESDNSVELDITNGEVIAEGIFQGIKNFFAKSFSTTRGKMLKFLENYVNFYEAEKSMLEAAIEHAKNVDEDDTRIRNLENQLETTKDKLIKSQIELKNYQDENIQAQEDKPSDLRSPQEKKVDTLHQQMKAGSNSPESNDDAEKKLKDQLFGMAGE